MPGSPPPTLWAATAGDDPPRYRDDTSGAVDVAIVGAGYTGLWTALSIVRAEPGTRVVVVDQETVGFGASGRNGGWCSALLPVRLSTIAARHGSGPAAALQRTMFDTIDEIGQLAVPAGTGFHKGGTVTLAHRPQHQHRLQAALDELRAFGFDESAGRLLPAAAATELCRADRVVGGLFTPHCAAVHPLRLVRAIADEARAAGVRIAEHTRVADVRPRLIATESGTTRAEVVVLATEAFTSALPGRRRDILPLYSMMIGSEPLGEDQWQQIGLADRPTFSSATNMVIYGQRTADGRLAFGGRGAPYHYASRIHSRFDTNERVRMMLVETVGRLFPALRGIAFPFHWGGPLGIARDWHPHARFDVGSGLASAGGYAGDGVAMANLAGRTLADLILGRDTDLTRLPIAGHRSRRWEPEPLRWLGVRLGGHAAARADRAEASSGRLAGHRARAWSALLGVVTGH